MIVRFWMLLEASSRFCNRFMRQKRGEELAEDDIISNWAAVLCERVQPVVFSSNAQMMLALEAGGAGSGC